jgi:hypothetical protein
VAVGLSSPLPCPQTARPSGYKGARNAREPATNPCSATGASGSHPRTPSLLTRSWAKPARTENAAAKQGRSTGQITPTSARDFPSRRTGRISPVFVTDADQTGTSPGTGGQLEIRDGTADCKPAMPSGGPPLAVLGVNLSHENGSERELSLPGLPRQFAQIAPC